MCSALHTRDQRRWEKIKIQEVSIVTKDKEEFPN